MGKLPQEYPAQHSTASANFSEVERRAFDHVGEHLAKMPYCSLWDLQSAAASYLSLYLDAQGFPMRREWIERKSSKWAAWWYRKHQDRRQPRPHTRYSAKSAQRGRVVSMLRRGSRADLDGLLVQLAALRGESAGQIAGQIGRTARHVRRLMGRRFSALLASIICGTFGKCSLSLLTKSKLDTQKETLANVRPCPNTDGTAEDVAGVRSTIGEIDRIRTELAALYPHRAADLAHWAAQGL